MRKRRKKENRKLREVPAAQQPERKKQRNRLGQSVQSAARRQKNLQMQSVQTEQSVRPKNEKPARTPKAKNVLADTSSKPKVRIIPLGGLSRSV